MACWDPFVPSSPIDRSNGLAVSWSPPAEIDRRKLLAGQLRLLELDDDASHDVIDPTCCNCCTASFCNQKDADQHEKLWHLPREVWSCPTKNDARTATYLQTGPLASFLFPSTTSAPGSSTDICPYCGECSEDIFYDLEEDINECSADWKIRIEHLEAEHNFDECPIGLKFFRPEQFLLHLVGSHNLRLGKWTKGVMDSCRRRKLVSPSLAIDDGRSTVTV